MTDSPPTFRRRPRFSLRTLLLLVVVVAVPMGWKVNRVRNQRTVVVEIERLNGQVYYDYYRYAYNNGGSPQLPGPEWLRNLLGVDFLADVVQVNVSGPQVTDDTLGLLSSLPHLQLLGADSDRITDSGVAKVARSKELISFDVKSKSVTVASIDHLQGLPNLQFLRCSGSQVDDSWIEHFVRLKSLHTLIFNDARLTDEGLAGLARLTTLDGLFFEDMPITDASLDQLHGMSNLTRIGLHNTQETKDGDKRLQEALPNSRIRHY